MRGARETGVILPVVQEQAPSDGRTLIRLAGGRVAWRADPVDEASAGAATSPPTFCDRNVLAALVRDEPAVLAFVPLADQPP